MLVADQLLTAAEYVRQPDIGQPTELVRGRLVTMNVPTPKHGFVCANVVLIVGGFVRRKKRGRVMGNDAGVVTERGPDTVRGADISFYSFERLPPGKLPASYLDVAPDVVFEVRSPHDRRSALLRKVAEYLEAGVRAVCVLDPKTESARVYRADDEEQRYAADDQLSLPEISPEFRIALREFFE